MESKLVQLIITNEQWIPLQAVVISLHNSLCWTCRGDEEPLPDRFCSSSMPPSLSIAIPVPLPHSGQKALAPSPPPLSPVTSNNSSIIPNSSPNSYNPFLIEARMFQAAQEPDGLIWNNEERAALQAFLTHYKSKEGVNVTILEAGEGDRLQEALECFQKALDLGRGEMEHDVVRY